MCKINHLNVIFNIIFIFLTIHLINYFLRLNNHLELFLENLIKIYGVILRILLDFWVRKILKLILKVKKMFC